MIGEQNTMTGIVEQVVDEDVIPEILRIDIRHAALIA